MIEAQRRKAEKEIDRYLRRYWHQFPPRTRDELTLASC
jgi:hypothetical protein